jgi:hypothetical protein
MFQCNLSYLISVYDLLHYCTSADSGTPKSEHLGRNASRNAAKPFSKGLFSMISNSNEFAIRKCNLGTQAEPSKRHAWNRCEATSRWGKKVRDRARKINYMCSDHDLALWLNKKIKLIAELRGLVYIIWKKLHVINCPKSGCAYYSTRCLTQHSLVPNTRFYR